MATCNLSPVFQDAQFSDAGILLSGGLIYWYLAGTTTAITVYQDAAGAAAHTQPIILNTRGEPPAPIYLLQGKAYKAILKTSAGVQIRVIDNITGVNDSTVLVGSGFTYVQDTGAANAYVINPTQPVAALATGQMYVFTATFASTGASTLNVSGLGAKAITLTDGASLPYGTISAGSIVEVVYNGTNFQLVNVKTPTIMGARNYIINGRFDFWQRGTSLGAGTGNRYLADRWLTGSVGSTVAPSRQAFSIGQTAVPGNPKYYHRAVIASVAGAANNAVLVQRIEDVTLLSGNQIFVAFWAKADAPKNMAFEMVQNFGTGGAPSAPVTNIGVTTIALTASWQRFTVAVTLPSVSGKTLGTNGDDYLAISMWFDAGSNFNARTNTLGQQSGTFDVGNFSIITGNMDVEAYERALGAELALCQRYYEKSYSADIDPGTHLPDGASKFYASGFSVGINIGSATVQFKQQKRAIPTIIGYSDATGASGKARDVQNSSDLNVLFSNYNQNSFVWSATAGGASATTNMQMQWTADAEL